MADERTPSDDPPVTRREMREARAAEQRSAWPLPIPIAWAAAIGALVVLLLAGGIALAASGGTTHHNASHGGGAPSSAAPPSTDPVTHKLVTGPPRCPLNGNPAPGGHIPAQPALAFKVDNYPDARPWSGVDRADIIFEEPVEGFITRLVAVYQCQSSPMVGPLRSARDPDQEIGDLLSKPILVHVGGIDQVEQLLDSSNLFNINLITTDSQIEQNPPGRVAPYDTYASTAGAWGTEPTDHRAPTPVFAYSSHLPSGGRTGTSLQVNFSATSDETWTYSPASATYALSYADTGPALVTQPNGAETQLSTANVVVQEVAWAYNPGWVENNLGGIEVMVPGTGSGPVEVFRNGKVFHGAWSRGSLSSPLVLKNSKGEVIALRPGPTWVDVVPQGQPINPAP